MTQNLVLSVDDNSVDDHVDAEIKECLRTKRKFFMFAGAGSGKTRSLVNALNFIATEFGRNIYLKQKRIAVITYTNAACDEIMRRVGYNPLFAVSTIHSFLWDLIKPFQKDIKMWVKNKLEDDIQDLQKKQSSQQRRKDYSGEIEKKKGRLEALKTIYKFNYNPNGENIGSASLDHADVIKMGASFIQKSSTMQKVLTSKFPILFIDESQDTKKELIDALWAIDADTTSDFTIGMFGDTMQRIYMDGKENLATIVPADWECPVKVMNHRSKKRIVQLANAIRKTIDKQEQQPRTDKGDGFVRLFVVPNTADKTVAEESIFERMSEITSDNKWLNTEERKILVLEHSMAAKRLGFATLDENLKMFDQSFRDGTLTELAFLMKVVYPIVQAKQNNNSFATMKLLRNYSPLMKEQLLISSNNQPELIRKISEKTDSLVELWSNDNIPNCIDVYMRLSELELFELPRRIYEVLNTEVEVSGKTEALRKGLNIPFPELIKYWDYINGDTQFATHQGIKGLEFDRVAVVMDDESAGGFLFSYEKLFGAKQISDTDIKNQAEKKDTAITRTMRLLYVTCTRARESLALIAYTGDVEAVKKTARDNGWFANDEIISF